MPQTKTKKTPTEATKTEAKKPVVKKVNVKRTVAKAAEVVTKKSAAARKSNAVFKGSKFDLDSEVAKLGASSVVKFSALPKNSLFKLAGRHYVKNFQGKALLLPPSVNLSKGDAKISALHVMATEVVTIKAGELVTPI